MDSKKINLVLGLFFLISNVKLFSLSSESFVLFIVLNICFFIFIIRGYEIMKTLTGEV